MGSYDKADEFNKTIDIAKKINDISVGVDYLYGSIKIELFAVTPNRLIQTGTTSGYTYDFETSQNLVVGFIDKESYRFDFKAPKDVGFNTHVNVDLWADKNDKITKIEIPQKEAYTLIVNFNKLNHNYHFTPQSTVYDDAKNLELCIPSFNNIAKIGPNCTMTHNNEILIDENTHGTGDDAYVIHKGTIVNRNQYPAIIVGQPKVNDETGIMKFRYNLRVTTEFHVNYKLTPEYLNTNTKNILLRQCYNLPQLATKAGSNYSYVYIPYTF